MNVAAGCGGASLLPDRAWHARCVAYFVEDVVVSISMRYRGPVRQSTSASLLLACYAEYLLHLPTTRL